MKGFKWRAITVIATLVFSVYLLIPTYLKFGHGIQIPRVKKPGDPWYFSVLPPEVLKLGLDLSGGLHLVLGIDFDEVNRDAIAKLRNQLKEAAEQKKVTGLTFDTTPDNKITVTYSSEDDWKRLDAVIVKDFSQTLDLAGQTANKATLQITSLWEGEVRKRAVDQSLETLRNRIDEFGIAEPIIQRQGEEKLLVQFPGIQETGRLKEIIARTAKLSFQLVRTGTENPEGPPTTEQLNLWVADFEKEKHLKLDPTQQMSVYLKELNTYLGTKMPAGTELLFHRQVDVNTRETKYVPYLLDKEAMVTGEDLQDAYYGFNPQTNEPIVNFQLSPVGATRFEKATGENVGRHMAIVLDNNVHSAPRIKTKIPGGRAVIEMGTTGRAQQDVTNDAKDTSLVLRSGSLPARLLFLEERTIGPSLGADAIRAGTISLLAGLGLVFLFMIGYYRLSGVVASTALALNGFFVLAAMAAFEGTLTLPGLAGLTLTLGMAVDANVLIYEHMREELRHGKAVNIAIAEGFRRAFSAIIDSHVTTIISSVVLFSFGYGPIRGFAVTTLIGLIASLFTAVFVTRVIFDYFVVLPNRKTLSV